MNYLESIGLTDEQKAARTGKIGGSHANIIMSGNTEKIMKLWEEMTGKREPEDLSNILCVMLGNATEEFNAAWYQKQTGDTVTNRGESRSIEGSYMACTLDGLCKGGDAVWEAKHVGGYESFETVAGRYAPQLHHNMIVCGLERAVLSVISGNSGYDYAEFELDPFYAEALTEAEEKFWRCVQEDTPPHDITPSIKPSWDKMRVVDMTGNNEWALHAGIYLDNKDAHKAFESAKRSLKKLVDDDVREASGYGITVARDKRGALRFKESST